jgi:hypothetical protein
MSSLLTKHRKINSINKNINNDNENIAPSSINNKTIIDLESSLISPPLTLLSKYQTLIVEDINKVCFNINEIDSKIRIFPSITNNYDLFIAERSMHLRNLSLSSSESPLSINNNAHILYTVDDIHSDLFNKLLWDRFSISNLSSLNEFLGTFASLYFMSKESVSQMTFIELSLLASWLSWIDNKNFTTIYEKSSSASSNKNNNNNILLFKEKWSDKVVPGLLDILNTNTKDPSCLAITVSCLSFLIDGHSMSDVVLTDTNISQLLQLTLSKAVYPSTSLLLSQEWEVSISRIGLRKLLKIPVVNSKVVTINEAKSFICKWWTRLEVATKGIISIYFIK